MERPAWSPATRTSAELAVRRASSLAGQARGRLLAWLWRDALTEQVATSTCRGYLDEHPAALRRDHPIRERIAHPGGDAFAGLGRGRRPAPPSALRPRSDPLRVRRWMCAVCHTDHDRDENAGNDIAGGAEVEPGPVAVVGVDARPRRGGG